MRSGNKICVSYTGTKHSGRYERTRIPALEEATVHFVSTITPLNSNLIRNIFLSLLSLDSAGAS